MDSVNGAACAGIDGAGASCCSSGGEGVEAAPEPPGTLKRECASGEVMRGGPPQPAVPAVLVRRRRLGAGPPADAPPSSSETAQSEKEPPPEEQPSEMGGGGSREDAKRAAPTALGLFHVGDRHEFSSRRRFCTSESMGSALLRAVRRFASMNGACGGVCDGGGEMRRGARGGEARANACADDCAAERERVGEDDILDG